jgi:hypothetical protein
VEVRRVLVPSCQQGGAHFFDNSGIDNASFRPPKLMGMGFPEYLCKLFEDSIQIGLVANSKYEYENYRETWLYLVSKNIVRGRFTCLDLPFLSLTPGPVSDFSRQHSYFSGATICGAVLVKC